MIPKRITPDRRILALLSAFALLLGVLSFVSCRRFADDEKKVLTFGNVTFSEADYRYICLKNMVQYYGEECREKDLTEEMRKTLSEAVEKEIRSFAAIEIMAEERNISLSEEDISEIESEINRLKLQYTSSDAYLDELEDRFMTDAVLYRQMCNEALDDKLYAALAEKIDSSIDEEQLYEDVHTYGYAATQILWTARDPQKYLEKIRSSIKNKDDFYRALEQYSADSVRGVRICFRGEMIIAFEEAALALEEGEISDVISSEIGGHIILREELTDKIIAEHLEECRTKDVVRIYRTMLEDAVKDIEITYEKGYEKMILS